MKQFMIDIDLPVRLTEEFISLIPEQRQQIDTLMSERKVLNYSLSLNRAKLWIIINARTEDAVFDILHQFPLFKFFKINVFELAFHQDVNLLFPQMSLN